MNSELRREPGVIFFFDIETYKLWIYFTLYRTVEDVAWAYLDTMIDITSRKNYYALFSLHSNAVMKNLRRLDDSGI